MTNPGNGVPSPAPGSVGPLWPALVADIGGTNARFALIETPGGAPTQVMWLKNADYPALQAALGDYLARTAGTHPRACCLAVAGPVTGDVFRFSNIAWEASQSALAKEFGFSSLRFVNDFEALAMGVSALQPVELLEFGGGTAIPSAPIAIIGPGTGLGVAGLFPEPDGRWRAVPTEGGHTDFAPITDLEIAILQALRPRFGGRVSAENILSGPGLAALHETLAMLDGGMIVSLSPPEIIDRGTADRPDSTCLTTLRLFCAILGSFAGNVALTTGARGGVVLGGGILPRLRHLLPEGEFRRRFEAKGRMSAYTAAIPTKLILADDTALRGAAACLGPGT